VKIRRVRAVARKEFLHIVRDSRSLIMSLALPALMLILFGWALTLDVDRIPIVSLDHAGISESRELLSRFEGSNYFDYLGEVSSLSAIETRIDNGTCLAGIVIPADFGENILRGNQADVQLILDGSDSNTASIGLGYARGILSTYELQLLSRRLSRTGGRLPSPPIDLRMRVWFNPEMESKNYIVPGLVAVILMIIAALLTSLTIAREWEMGTMEQLLSTPLRPSELVLGKMSAYFILGATDALIAVVLGVVIFEVPLRGSVFLLGLGCFIFLFGALCWGIFISATVRSQLLAYQLGMITSFLPAFLLSGFIYSIGSMPLPIQIVTYIFPARYFVSILKGIFLKGVGFSVLGFEFLFLTIFALIVFLATTRKLKGKIA